MKAVSELKIKVLKGDKRLKDFEIVDRTTIHVEIKEKEESDQEVIRLEDNLPPSLNEREVFNIDETPNLRSCLVHQVDPNVQVERFTVDILAMTIKDLTNYIIKELKLNG